VSSVSTGLGARRPFWHRAGDRARSRGRAPEGLSRADKAMLIFGALLLLVVIVLPPLLPHGTTDLAGAPLTSPSGAHLFGTDEQGYEILTRVAYGMRTSIFAAAVVIASGVVIGGVIGLVAGIAGGWVDAILMRFTDLFLALPGPLLVLAVVAALGASLRNTLIGLAVVWWPWYARIVRGQVRATASRPHVEAARLAGLSRFRVAFRHILPGSFSPIIVTASLDIGNVILLLASLSFLGLGSSDTSPELGAMTARGLTYLFTAWWVAVIPAAAVFVLAFVGNFAGDAIRDMVED
jgi:peptide/nickel transport system permease protein